MLTVRLDVNSSYSVRWPSSRRSPEIIKLGQAFVAFDGSLPLDEQSPFLPDLTELLGQALPVTTGRISSETERTIAAERVKRLEDQAHEIAQQVKAVFGVVFAKTPEEGERWGLMINQATRNILLPRNREEKMLFLDTYVTAEEKRAQEERFSSIDFDEVRRVRDELKANLDIRKMGRIKRVAGTAQRNMLAEPILFRLQMAAAYLLARRFDYKLTPELGKWGFKVVER